MARNLITVFLSLHMCFQLPTLKALVQEEEWDYLVLAQFWPSSSCVYFKESDCVPPQVHNWTIHGLWPSDRATSKQPENCNKSMNFNYDEIKPLRPDLDLYWPYFNKSSKDRTSLWAHEWDKHGTCAYSLPTLRGEFVYFTQVLKLYHQQDLIGALAKANIVPSDSKQYNINDIFNAVNSIYGTSPVISCVTDTKEHYLAEIWLCFEKNLTRADCEESAQYHVASDQHRAERRPYLKFRSEKEQVVTKGKKFVDCPSDLVWYKPITTIYL
ncbi:unnamed protein product [Lymnaea stagnalis]|uniref:Uncharacterized protein n=1 Tax=Lymnaea stagnalis TaxID=6523 RepID=A0AAV2HGJ2_LYMST